MHDEMILETVSNQASRAPGHLDIVHVHVQATVETIMQKALLKSGRSKSVTSEIRTQVATATTWSTNHYTNATDIPMQSDCAFIYNVVSRSHNSKL